MGESPSRCDARRFAHAHAGGLDAEGGLRGEAAAGAAPRDKQVGNLVCHQRAIRNFIIPAFFQFFKEIQFGVVDVDGVRRARPARHSRLFAPR